MITHNTSIKYSAIFAKIELPRIRPILSFKSSAIIRPVMNLANCRLVRLHSTEKFRYFLSRYQPSAKPMPAPAALQQSSAYSAAMMHFPYNSSEYTATIAASTARMHAIRPILRGLSKISDWKCHRRRVMITESPIETRTSFGV